MKIIHISDTHRQERYLSIPDGDVLIHSGDIDARSIPDVVEFNVWLKKLPHKKKIFVPGNHDFIFQTSPNIINQFLTEAEVLIDASTTYEGVKFFGSPWTLPFFDWAFMKNELELAEIYQKAPSNIDVLITHGPPFGVLDYIKRSGCVGSNALLHLIYNIRPKLHLFGHIHEGYGTKEFSWDDNGNFSTLFSNGSVLDERYGLVNEARILEI